MRGYEKTGDDNGRCEGTFDKLTAEHIVGHSMILKNKKEDEWSNEIEEETSDENT